MEPNDEITFQENNLGKDYRHYHSYSLHENNYGEFFSVLLII